MKLTVNTAMKGVEIREILENYNQDGISFKFVQKIGLKHEFEAEGVEGEDAVALVKSLVRATDFGKGLYFSVAAG